MNAEQAIEILTEQRDSFKETADGESDFGQWCQKKAEEFDEIIKWIEENAE